MAYYYAARRRNRKKLPDLLPYQPQLDRPELYISDGSPFGRRSFNYVTDIDGNCWLHLFDLTVVFSLWNYENIWQRLPQGSCRRVVLPISVRNNLWRTEYVVNADAVEFLGKEAIGIRKRYVRGLVEAIRHRKGNSYADTLKVTRSKCGTVHVSA